MPTFPPSITELIKRSGERQQKFLKTLHRAERLRVAIQHRYETNLRNRVIGV